MHYRHSDFHTLLIFPPVWTPATPYLALPVLAGFLKDREFQVNQWDAGLDFFIDHLFTIPVLSQLSKRLEERHQKGELSNITAGDRNFLDTLNSRIRAWNKPPNGPQAILDVFRSERSFFNPERCIQAQHEIYDILRLVSLAHWPLRMTFNKYFHTITTFADMVRHCDDPQENLFLSYYASAVPGHLHSTTRLVGISISTAQQLVGALTLARWIKKNYPQIHITLGGKHLLRLKEAFLGEPQYMQEFCHSLIMDNGERPLAELIPALQRGGDLSHTPNLIYMDDGLIRENPMCSREPLDQLPAPDFQDLRLNRYLSPSPLIPMRLSEGCYWGKCTFCARYYQSGFNTVQPRLAVEHMAELQTRYGVEDFTINDDCLTPRYLETLSKEIVERGLKVYMSLWCKPVHTFTRERLRLMHRAGVRLIRWGVETGHPRILKLMNKGTILGETVRVLKDSSRAGIWNHACMILGFPSETEEEGRETLDFLARNRDVIHSSILYRFVLLDHSYIFNHPEEFTIHSMKHQGNVFSNVIKYSIGTGMDERSFELFYKRALKYMRREVYKNPFWQRVRIREYLYLFVKKYGREEVESWKMDPDGFIHPYVSPTVRSASQSEQ